MENSAPGSTPSATPAPAGTPATTPAQMTPPSQPEVVSVAKKSSGNMMIIGIIVVIIILIAGVFGYKMYKASKTASAPQANSDVNQNSTPAPSQAAIPTSTVDPVDADAQAIDNSMNSVDQELNNVDSGMNEKPGDLSVQ
jgi:cytoskeletal protein RodZ